MLKSCRRALTPLTLLFAASPSQAQTNAEQPLYWHHNWGWGWGHMVFGSTMMILFLGGILVLVVFIIRRAGSDSKSEKGSSTSGRRALEILERRFARGELDKTEYEERRRQLLDESEAHQP